MIKRLTLAAAVAMLMSIFLAMPQSAQAVLYEVEIEDFSFIPAGLHINVGDAIEWRNRDNVSHSATSDNGIWDSGLLARDDTYTYTFNEVGTFPYHCSAHPLMRDTVVVGTPTSVDGELAPVPDRIKLSQNYPNPFNAQTEISYTLPHAAHVKITVYNLLGQEIVTLVDQDQAAGAHRVVWDATNAPTGVYFYRLQAGDYAQSRRMVLLK